MSPLPGPSDIDQVYEEEYFRAYSESGIAMPAEAAEPPARYVRRLRAVQTHHNGRSLLEVGPGSGAFLNYARNAGWNVVGVETSRYAAQIAASRYNLDIRCGTLLTVDLSPKQFDVVHMSHVLEHLREPEKTLLTVFKVLKPGGSLIIEVPHELQSLQFRLLKALGLPRPYRVGCSHIWFFTPSTLKALLERSGFRHAVVRTTRDLEGGSPIRRMFRRTMLALERPLGAAPLIEAIAHK